MQTINRRVLTLQYGSAKPQTDTQQSRARVAKPGNGGGLKIRSRRGPCVQIASLASQDAEDRPFGAIFPRNFSHHYLRSRDCSIAADSRSAPVGSRRAKRVEAEKSQRARKASATVFSRSMRSNRIPRIARCGRPSLRGDLPSQLLTKSDTAESVLGRTTNADSLRTLAGEHVLVEAVSYRLHQRREIRRVFAVVRDEGVERVVVTRLVLAPEADRVLA